MNIQPGPAQKPRRTLMIVLLAIAAVLALCVTGTVIIGLLNKTTPAPTPAPTTSFDPADIGAGTPDAPCATSRLGKSFIKDGITYTCQGPEPYRWRKS